MEKSKKYIIPFSGLKVGKHEFEFTASKEFFDQYAIDEFYQIDVKIKIELDKLSTMLILGFYLSGTISTDCDRCADRLDVSFETKEKLYAKFGEGESDDENIIFLPQSEYQIDIANYIYEFSITSLFSNKVHADEEDCNQDIITRLNSLAVNTEKEIKEETNPMWAKLKELKK